MIKTLKKMLFSDFTLLELHGLKMIFTNRIQIVYQTNID